MGRKPVCPGIELDKGGPWRHHDASAIYQKREASIKSVGVVCETETGIWIYETGWANDPKKGWHEVPPHYRFYSKTEKTLPAKERKGFRNPI